MFFSKWYFLFLATLLCAFPLAAKKGQFKYKISLDGGAAQNSFGFSDSQNFLLARFFGQLRYFQIRKSYDWSIRGDFRPEVFLADGSTSNLLANLKGQFVKKGKKFSGLVFASYKQQYLNLERDKVSINTAQFGGQYIRPYKSIGIFSLSGSYYAREFFAKTNERKNGGAAFLQWQKSLKGAITLQVSGYGEWFYIRSLENRNNGMRAGPQIGISYRRNYIINTSYRFLFHQSDITRPGSNEQHLRLLMGKLLNQHWSLFFLLDYYFRHYHFHPNQPSASPLVYIPIDTENRFYFKLEREINPLTTLYLRIGYLNEDLTRQQFSYAGWQGTLGITFRK